MDGALRDIPKDGWEYEPIGPTAFGISKGGHVANFFSFVNGCKWFEPRSHIIK